MVLCDNSKKFVFGINSRKQLIQFQVTRITLFTLEFQFLFDIRNDESYLTLKGTVMWIEKLNTRNHRHKKRKKSLLSVSYVSYVITLTQIINIKNLAFILFMDAELFSSVL